MGLWQNISPVSLLERGTANGQMLFWNNNTRKYEYTNIDELIWDDTDKELGIGYNLPNEPLHVRSDFDGNKAIRIQNESLGTKAVARVILDTSGGSCFFVRYGINFATIGARRADSGAIVANANTPGGFSTVVRHPSAPYRIYTGGNLDANLRFIVLPNGNIGIGNDTPTSVLHVSGLPVYANNAAAILGNLTPGAFYRTGGDPDQVCVVH